MVEVGVIASALSRFRGLKKLADGAISQLEWDQLRAIPAASPQGASGNNSVAIVMKHVAGNMRSRWTDFLTTDGEKPDRRRDQEFVDDFASRDELIAVWEGGWSVLFAALEPLTDADLQRVVTIRGEPHSVLEAIHRQLTHYAYHVGQIVSASRWFLGDGWQSLSIPRGASDAYNQKMATKFGGC